MPCQQTFGACQDEENARHQAAYAACLALPTQEERDQCRSDEIARFFAALNACLAAEDSCIAACRRP
jgi:hypothetical protein